MIIQILFFLVSINYFFHSTAMEKKKISLKEILALIQQDEENTVPQYPNHLDMFRISPREVCTPSHEKNNVSS